MNKINFSIDSLLGLDTNQIDTEYDKQRCNLDGSSVPMASPASTVRSEESQMSQASDGSQSNGEKSKGPFCAKCKLHSEYYPVKNHKDKCKRRYCDCDICKLIDEGKSLRGKKKIKMHEATGLQHLSKDIDSRSSSGNLLRQKSLEDILTLAADFKSDLRRIILQQDSGPDDRKMERLLSSVLFLLLQRNRFDSSILKRKISSAKMIIEEARRSRSCNSIGSSTFLADSSEIVPFHPTSPINERLMAGGSVSSSGPGSIASAATLTLGLGSNSGPNFLGTTIPAMACPSLLNPSSSEYLHSPPTMTTLTTQPFFSTSLLCPSYYPLASSTLSAPYQSSISNPAILHDRNHPSFHANASLYNFLTSNSGAINLCKRGLN
ncbi:uncharacterized protein LOC141854998 [Brevipalpus obovatus]|uniref:uncharacterized protein LOC141854998 n=1 Tax=Brevipalpus obovatus TaxID=246614 RepID=UPI003D9E2766